MTDYVKLANHIDEVYHSGNIPHSEESAFVKIFQVLLTREEAAGALYLDNLFVTAELLSERMKTSYAEAEKMLNELAKKGIAFRTVVEDVCLYKLMPYFPGIVESLIAYLDRAEIAEQLQIYMNELLEYRNSALRKSIPVNYSYRVRQIRATGKEIQEYLDKTEWYAVCNCFCRTVNKQNGKACGHSIKDMCIQTGSYARYYIDTGRSRRVDRTEVQAILKEAEQEGMYHEIYPTDDTKENAFICNCCTCGCLFMELSGRIERALEITSYVSVDQSLCDGCGQCVYECPEQAFVWNGSEKKIEFIPDDCFNCGLCIFACKNSAISMKTEL